MDVFVVMARSRFGDKCQPLLQVQGSQQKAIRMAQHVFKKGTMNRAVVLDNRFKCVFKVDRRCKCVNAQYRLDGRLVCEDCGLELNKNGYTVEVAE